MPDQNTRNAQNELFENWMNTATDLWGSMAELWPDADFNGAAESQKMPEAWEKVLHAWEALGVQMHEEEVVDQIFKPHTHIPDQLIKIIFSNIKLFAYFSQNWVKSAENIKTTLGKTPFDIPPNETFYQALRKIYENEFRRFFTLPQIGLAREYQKKFSEFFDKFNLFQNCFFEFLYLIALPFKQTSEFMQKKMAEAIDSDPLPDDFNAYYQLWIQKLEEYYSALYKSPKYTEALGKALKTWGELKIAAKEVFQDTIKMSGIPVEKDMDELYKDLYLLKKRVKMLEKKIQEKEN